MPPADFPTSGGSSSELLHALCGVPSLRGGVALPARDGIRLELTWQSRAAGVESTRSWTTRVPINEGTLEHGAEEELPAVEDAPSTLRASSPSGKRALVVKAGGGGNGGGAGNGEAKPVRFEVWTAAGVELTLEVPPALHGPLLCDPSLGGAAWSADERAVVYVAESPQPERSPEWAEADLPSPGGASGAGGRDPAAPSGAADLPPVASAPSWRGEAPLEEDWGERLEGKRPGELWVLDLEDRRVRKVAGDPSRASFAQPQWAPSGLGLVFVVYPHAAPNFPGLPRRLGLAACQNRPAHLGWAPYLPEREGSGDGAEGGGDGDGPSSAPRASLTAVARAYAALTPRDLSAFSPRFSPSGGQLVFLSADASVASGAHAGTVALRAASWAEGEAGGPPRLGVPRDLVPVDGRAGLEPWGAVSGDSVLSWVGPPAAGTGAGAGVPAPAPFPGLYAASLPRDPFLGPSRVVLATQWGAAVALVSVCMATGEVSRLTPPGAEAWDVVDARDGWLVASRSSHSSPTDLLVARVPEAGGDRAKAPDAPSTGSLPLPLPPLRVVWERLDLPGLTGLEAAPSWLHAHLEGVETTVLRVRSPDVAELDARGARLTPPTGDDASLPPRAEWFEAIVVRRRPGKAAAALAETAARPASGARGAPDDTPPPSPPPAVLVPHGGPHAAFSGGFFAPWSFLVARGAAVVAVNYRGSTGYGEGSVQSLPGRAGRDDVADTWKALAAAQEAGLVAPGPAALVGGSHGGFISLHFAAAFPSSVAASVLRNPVADLELMSQLTDIPDWCYVEALGVGRASRLRAAVKPTDTDRLALRAASPSTYVTRAADSPALFLLGAKDRRVPCRDGEQYASALLALRAARASSRAAEPDRLGAPPPADAGDDSADPASSVRVIRFANDGHGLNRLRTEIHQWLCTLSWIEGPLGLKGGKGVVG